MGFIKAIRVGFFAARVSNSLLDIGIDVNKFHPMLADSLVELEQEEYKQKSPQETATFFLLTYMSVLPSSTYLFSSSLPELVSRTETILHLWVEKGKMEAEVADHYIVMLHEKLESTMNAFSEYLSSSSSAQ